MILFTMELSRVMHKQSDWYYLNNVKMGDVMSVPKY